MDNQIEISVGEEMFVFRSCQHWVDKAKGWYAAHGATSYNSVAVDGTGRICTSGKEFMRAEDEGTYPIRVFNILGGGGSGEEVERMIEQKKESLALLQRRGEDEWQEI